MVRCPVCGDRIVFLRLGEGVMSTCRDCGRPFDPSELQERLLPGTAQGVWLFVGEQDAPEGWVLRSTAAAVIDALDAHSQLRVRIDRMSLGDCEAIPDVLEWMRSHRFWPTELYLRTTHEGLRQAIIEHIRGHAPATALRTALSGARGPDA